jgi:hypothetical protein
MSERKERRKKKSLKAYCALEVRKMNDEFRLKNYAFNSIARGRQQQIGDEVN